jgi:radical SAM protein with 4Fe4S-binding SPASM domain
MPKISYRFYSSIRPVYELIQWKKAGKNIFLISCPTELKGEDIQVNRSAFDILKLMDGEKRLFEIVKQLQGKYPGEARELSGKVKAFVQNMVSMGVVENLQAPEKRKKEIILINSDYWLKKLQIEITPKCNLRCKHCYVYSEENQKEMEIPTDKMKDVIVQAKKVGTEVVSLTGGEPFLREDIFDILTYINSKNMATIILSNGTLIDQEIAEKLSTLRNIYMAISLDGPKEAHESLRDVKGCFSKTLRGIKNLMSYGVPLRINFMVNRYVLGKSKELIRTLKELGYDKPPRLGIILNLGRAQSNNVCVTVAEFAEEYRKYWEAIKEFLGLKKYPVKALEGNNCGVGEDSLAITSEGNIIPCPPLNREPFILGNIYCDKLSDVWNDSEKLEKIRDINTRRNKGCMSCKFWEYCKGGCRISAMISSGGHADGFFNSPNPFACARWRVVKDDIEIVKECSEAFLMSQLI